VARDLVVNDALRIPAKEISLSFARSAGPGGQNVNKVNSKAILRWDVLRSTSLPPAVKTRFLQRFSNRVNQQGELVLNSDCHREQSRNLSACYDLLRKLILSVSTPPRPRVRTRPTRSSVERRLQSKQQRSKRKQMRRNKPGNED